MSVHSSNIKGATLPIPMKAEIGMEDDLKIDVTLVACQGMSFQRIEEILRSNQSNIHLVAENFQYDRCGKLVNPSGGKANHIFSLVIGDREKALSEILKHSSSEAENFEKLAETGFRGV